MTKPTDLYRAFDSAGNLLYVGIAFASIGRLAGHRSKSTWFDRVATITVETLPTRDDAKRAERLAIRTENPMFNLVRYLMAKRSYVRKQKVPRPKQHASHVVVFERHKRLQCLSEDCIAKARARDMPGSGFVEMTEWREAYARLSGV